MPAKRNFKNSLEKYNIILYYSFVKTASSIFCSVSHIIAFTVNHYYEVEVSSLILSQQKIHPDSVRINHLK